MFYFFYLVSVFFFFKQKTAYEMRISDWSSDVCSSDLGRGADCTDHCRQSRFHRVSQAGPAPLRGGVLALTAFALALGTFMQVLDSTIANVSLPTIGGSRGVSADSGTWIVSYFAVATGVPVPLPCWLLERLWLVGTFVMPVFISHFA